MRRLAALLLLALPAPADGRPQYTAARDALLQAEWGSLAPDERDRLFEKLGLWDQPETVKGIADVASGYGTWLAGLESKQDELHGKLRPLMDRQGLTDLEIGMRSSWLREQANLEEAWRRGQQSLDLLANVLGGLHDARTIQSALTLFPKHPTWRVRYLLAGACARWHASLRDEKQSRLLFGALKQLRADEEPRIRVAVARALGAYKRTEALEVLLLFLKDADWRVRASAVASLRGVRDNAAVTALIETMKKEEGRLRDDINSALQSITGENHGFADTWARWWDDVGRELPPARPATAEGGGEPVTSRAEQASRFYGIPTLSTRICYIIDISGSMLQPVKPPDPAQPKKPAVTGGRKPDPQEEPPVPGKTRFEVAQNELKRAIGNLNGKQQFTIIFFAHAVRPWRTDMVRATPESKEEAYKAIDGAVASGATYTLGALREAFAIAGARVGGGKKSARRETGIDTIFLLSDGAPTDSQMDSEAQLMDPQIILQAVREWNKDLKIVIHTIAVDLQDNSFLRMLAAENGGMFVERKG
ncbi:MAG: HEAT repeat domain-containing protein, partial [Planctomycetota bacterium]